MRYRPIILSIILASLLVFSAAFAYAEKDLKQADELFAQRANVVLFEKAVFDYELYYTKNPPDHDKAIFMARCYFYFAERYGPANKRKAISNYKLGAKWADVALKINPDSYQGKVWKSINIVSNERLKVKINADEAVKKAKEGFEALMASQPDQYTAYWFQGKLYREVEEWPVGYRDYDESEKLLKKALTLSNSNPEVALELVKTYVAKKDYKAALLLITEMKNMQPEKGWEVEGDLAKQEAEKILIKMRNRNH